jgi:hypothetical protein
MSGSTVAAHQRPTSQASPRVTGISLHVTVVAGLLVPGAGLVVAIYLWFTVLRNNRLARTAAVVIGLAMLGLLWFLYSPTSLGGSIGPAVPVSGP